MNSSILALCIFLLMLVFQIRNNAVFSARMQFLFKTEAERALFEALPSYDAMLFHPKHWGRWTKAQWAAYANRVTKK